MQRTPNRLIQESSPYLLQHAYNPVDWYPWGEEALKRAKEEDKPILVSIGYSACHWCHVMEKESFEDEATAQYMNRHFINIKIDREERPDLDHIYMDAVQAMTGSGGWPLNVFLTPDGRPFFGGTYFPPVRAFNRPSWKELLQNIVTAFQQRRSEINKQAETLVDHLVQANSFGMNKTGKDELLARENIVEIFNNIMKQADTQRGGFGPAPKFPQPFVIRYLLRYYHVSNDEISLQQALLSIDKMIEGGIYDQLGGGFARYATDSEWLVPHFEKMLYDNALLLSVISEAYQLTKKTRYRDVLEETMQFLQREMMHPDGGFYSALDADSEGEEGKYYVWSYQEVKDLLHEDAPVFCSYYDISETGNWEGKNILRVKEPAEEFAQRHHLTLEELNAVLAKGRKILLEKRQKRIPPALDDKVILGWNALMNIACSHVFAATGIELYRELALKNMDFLLQNFKEKDTVKFYHTWKNGKAAQPAFLDDYAFLIQALIRLQEISGDTGQLHLAKQLMDYVMKDFGDETAEFFYYTGLQQKDVLFRKKEMYDGAVPSGNSVMAYNLYYLSRTFGNQAWKDRCCAMLSALSGAIIKYPVSFAHFAGVMLEVIDGSHEIVITGLDYSHLHKEVLEEYLPHRILMATGRPDESFPLLKGKHISQQSVVYLCRDYTCRPPVATIEAFRALINKPICG